jgi:Na+/melibiose symporter-like transporter
MADENESIVVQAAPGGAGNGKGGRLYHLGSLTYTNRGLSLLFFWLLWGAFFATVVETVIPNIVPLKLKSLGASALLISIFMTSLPGVIRLVWNPVISTWSDRYRSRWGRRIPFLLAGTPAMAMIFVAMGFSDPIGHFIVSLSGGALTASDCTIGVVVILLLLFTMCNSFVWDPYWLLFNDTVPTAVMGRFSMMFRIVSTISVVAFNFLIFPYAETHYREMFLFFGVFFTVAYTLMCLNVKEGEYPPPPPKSQSGESWLGKVTTYFRESFGHRFYWDICLGAALTQVGNAAVPFMLLMNKSMGLNLQQIGWIAGYGALISLPVFFVAGLFIDRWNVVKVFAYLRGVQTVISAGFLIFLFVDMPVDEVLVVSVVLNLLLLGVTAVMLVVSVPINMRLLPRERFGQFMSAISMLVGFTGVAAGILMGCFIDVMRWVHHGSEFAYRYTPVWLVVFYGLASFYQFRVFRYVHEKCGDNLDAFVPPDTSSNGTSA